MSIHPNSLANLRPNRKGSKPKYKDLKKQRSVTLTETGWSAVKNIAKEKYGLSVSELLEQIGRGNISLPDKVSKI